MHCPVCGSRRLRINVLLAGSVTCNFADEQPVEVLEATEFDSLWNDDARCDCPDCSWTGVVAEASESADELSQATPLTEEMARIERELKAGQCPTSLADSVRLLMDAVRSLQAQVQLANRLARPSSGSAEDTAIF
jgi:hypothetical protein